MEMGSPAVGLKAWPGWETRQHGQQGNGFGVKRFPGLDQVPGARRLVPGALAARSRLAEAGNDGVAQLQPWIGLAVLGAGHSNQQR